ncbi:hypothetical protein REPUB_Repub20aG0008900 [Reevesia pubescens]
MLNIFAHSALHLHLVKGFMAYIYSHLGASSHTGFKKRVHIRFHSLLVGSCFPLFFIACYDIYDNRMPFDSIPNFKIKLIMNGDLHVDVATMKPSLSCEDLVLNIEISTYTFVVPKFPPVSLVFSSVNCSKLQSEMTIAYRVCKVILELKQMLKISCEEKANTFKITELSFDVGISSSSMKKDWNVFIFCLWDLDSA